MWLRTGSLLALVGLSLLSIPSSAVTIEWVLVGEPGNPPDPDVDNCWNAGTCGAVDHVFLISKYEITNAQYAEFLNAKAADDPHGLYNPQMAADEDLGGIVRSGEPGSYSYAPKPGFANKPVTYVSFWDVLRFVNWLNNGQGDGDTETGSYTLTPEGIANNTVTRNPGAEIVLPTENEWYKAAYYVGGGTYYDYPTPDDHYIVCVPPEQDEGHMANCSSSVWELTEVGAYALTVGPWGTYDQVGNAWELNETIMAAGTRGRRGSGAGANFINTVASAWAYEGVTTEFGTIGFRVARLLPEPGAMACAVTALAALAALASRRRRA
ncbi:MAG TPA: SUMF1/EgtB/PvdO family nonheme iron enzyme [Sandaracinaceae bacterium]